MVKRFEKFSLIFSISLFVIPCQSSRSNDRNMPTQHIATHRNTVGRNMLRAFGHCVATCCEVLGVVGSNLTIFKLEPTTPNMSQHIATWWPNVRNLLRPTMLRYVALACCDRLAGDPCSFIVYYYLFGVFLSCKVLFSGFLQLNGHFVDGQNNSKYREKRKWKFGRTCKSYGNMSREVSVSTAFLVLPN